MAAPTLDWAPPEAASAQAPQPDTWQPPEATASWAPPEAQSQEQAWTPPEAEQSPLETGLRTIAQDLGSLAMTGVSGLGRYFEDLSGVANQVVPGLGDVLDYAPQSALFQALAPVAEDLRQETETVYNPDAQRNPIAATVGGGIGQALGMVPMIATGGTPLVLGAAAASGYGQGSETAEDLGVQNPAGRMALGAGFGAAETLVERLGGIGAGPVRAAGREVIESLGKSTVKTIGSETLEEPATGVLQDAASLVAASTVTDPNRPGFTITGQPIAPLLPNSPEYWKSRGMEAIGGAAGGTVFAGLGALGRLTQRPDQTATPTIEGDLPGTPTTPTATAPTEAQVIANGTTYAYDTTQLTADQIQTLAATGSLQEYIDQGMVRNVFAPPPLPTAAATPATSPGTLDPGNVGSPPPPVVDTPGPTVEEARQTLGDIGNVGSQFAGATTVGRAGPAPLPRDPEGNYDLLNHLNENPIRAPRKGTEGAAAAEYDWREAGDFDPAYRSRIMQEGAPNIDQRAQEAYDLGFIPEPTPQALADEVRSAIAKRNQQRRQGPGQSRLLNEQEQAQVQFEQTQERLATTGQPIDLDQLAPGDTLRIGGQPVTVADIDYDEDGYTTRALLRTPTGTVRVTPESNLRADASTTAPTPRTLGDINAELAAWADQTIAQGQGQMSMGLDPTLLAAYTVKGAQLIAEGFTTFGRWSKEMLRRFGAAVRQYLAEAWQSAKKNSQVGALDIGGNVTRMASDLGAAQNTEPSTGGLEESYAKYLEARKAGNRRLAQHIVNEVAGVQYVNSSIDRQGAHSPSGPDDGSPLWDIAANGVYPEDVYGPNGLRYYSTGEDRQDREAFQQIQSAKGSPNKKITIYRALEKSGPTQIKPGEWVTTVKAYAKDHGENALNGDYKIISKTVSAKDIFTSGDSWLEWGYHPQPAFPDAVIKGTDPQPLPFERFAKLSESARAEAGAGFTNTQVVATRPDGSTVIFSELVDIAGQGIRAGLTLAQWTAAMIRRFGQAVRRYLAEAWQSAKKNSQVGARANLNPNARLSARPPTLAEALEGQTRQSQFGERVQADERLTDPLRAAPVSTFAIQGQQQALDQANAIIRQLGLEGATATFQNDATLPMPVRIAGLMQAALQYDARAALALRQGNEAGSAAADAATEAAIQAKASLEFIGNESGRNVAMFKMWNRMSPDGQLRRLDRNLAKAARDTIRGDTGVTPAEVTDLVNEETANLDLDAILEEVLTEGNTPRPVNLQTGAPIARNGTIIDRLLGGLETTARAISESTTIQRAVEAIDNVLKALSGKLFADPLLLTPIGQAVLRTTRTLLLQGTKISQAIADAIAVVRTRTPIPPQDVAPLTQAVTSAVVKEVIRPILRKLAFDPNYNKREATKDMLAIGIGVMEAGRLADAVIAKRPKIAKAAQDIVRQRVMRRLSDKPRSKSRKQKLPAIIDTLVLAAGAGFINERTFLDAWDKKYPLPKLTPADRVRLRQMAAAINLLPEGILRQAEAIKFQNEVALIEGIAAVDAITAAWYANLLAGISTQGVNIWGNGLNLFFRSLAVGLASPADVTKLFSGLAAGVRPGLREAKQVIKTGQLLKVNKMDDMQVSGTLELMATQGGPKGFGQWLAYVMSLGGLTRYVFRAMGAMDAVFWYSAQEGMAHLAASRTLRKAGGLKPGTQQFNAEFIRQLGGDETQYLADLDQARTELKAAGVAVTPGAVNRRAWEIRQQRRSLDIRDASVRWADRNVMQQQPEGIGRAITGIITILQKVKPAGVPIFVPLVPFNRILSNLFESSLDWAGIGILRGIVGSHLTDMTNKDRRLFDTVERRERFMAGMLGMGIAGTLLAAAMALKDMDDDEVPFMVYAMGPPDPTGRGTMPKGWRPYSIKINGQYVSFAESPMGPLLGAVGAWMDSTRYGKTENKTLVDRGFIAFHNALNSFMSMGVLSSMKDIVELWSGQGGARSLKQAALSPVAGFVPAQGLLRDMAPLFDNTKISDADVFGALVKDIPVFKSYGLPDLNVLGEEIKIAGIPVVRRFATGKEPDANISFIQKHKLRISAVERTIDIGDYLPKRERIALGLEDSDRRRALGMTAIENGIMTPAQQYQFTQRQGEIIRKRLEALRKEFPQPSTPQLQTILQKRLDASTAAARLTAMRELVAELR